VSAPRGPSVTERQAVAHRQPPHTTDSIAHRLTALADWIGERLDNEEYGRQAVAESVVAQLREIAKLATGVHLGAGDLEMAGRAMADAVEYQTASAGAHCRDCGDFRNGLCADHAHTLATLQGYQRLAARLAAGAQVS
jgi:hypothetical protein